MKRGISEPHCQDAWVQDGVTTFRTWLKEPLPVRQYIDVIAGDMK
jgi:hypothetical protein